MSAQLVQIDPLSRSLRTVAAGSRASVEAAARLLDWDVMNDDVGVRYRMPDGSVGTRRELEAFLRARRGTK